MLKPGGHIVVFAAARTYHRMACGIEEAGFELRDQIMWVFGSGFPKSKNLNGDREGWGTALKPAHEPICLARKPLGFHEWVGGLQEVGHVCQVIGGPVTEKHQLCHCGAKRVWRPLSVAGNVARWGTGALNIDGCRIEGDKPDTSNHRGGIPCRHDETTPRGPRGREGEQSHDRRYTENGGTNFAATPGPRGGDPAGRWPANLVHDGSDEVLAHFPHVASGKPAGTRTGGQGNAFGHFNGGIPVTGFGDSGSAARFFYCAKATRAERDRGCESLPRKIGGMVSNTSGQMLTRRDGGAPGLVGNNHPTVKPIALMRWLIRLVTPPGGTVLDCFTGSGSTGCAADMEGMQFIGIELDPDYVAIAEARRRAIQPGLSMESFA